MNDSRYDRWGHAGGRLDNPAARLVNLTPHAIVVFEGPTIPPSGQVARCSTEASPAGEHAGAMLSRVSFGAVEGLPEPEAGVLFIVSGLVRSAVPERSDVASPGDLVRDTSGAVVGCRHLVVN
jgi:hypothetical protein